ncbi:hypothetical protein [Hyphococcus sp.]|uniref:hypothetical protein n=1 Tax=Hyphococcus sp. TaxID=2038636 RepID=UPI003CCBC8AE
MIMRVRHVFLGLAVTAAAPSLAFANNACTAPAIITSAQVTTSDGQQYDVDTFYRSPEELGVLFSSDGKTEFVIEGGLAWTRAVSEEATRETLAGDRERRFAIGHQFHALALNFETIATNIVEVRDTPFAGGVFGGLEGDYPFGGKITLLQENAGRPHGLILSLPEEADIHVEFGAWRAGSGAPDVPYALTITHEERVFNYEYTEVSVLNRDHGKDSIDFHELFAAPSIDELHILRLHRALLTAHCRGDADMMAALTAPETIVANRGELTPVTSDETRSRFQSVFSRVDYTAYHDLKDPVIQAAQSGDIGWIAVNPLAEGQSIETGETFSSQWAWVMMARKIDGVWLNAGNASNINAE